MTRIWEDDHVITVLSLVNTTFGTQSSHIYNLEFSRKANRSPKPKVTRRSIALDFVHDTVREEDLVLVLHFSQGGIGF